MSDAAAVDRYLESVLLADDPALDGALQRATDAGLPPIQVSAMQGKLLHLLVRSIEARRVLEFGTLAGYSAIWMARGLADGGRLTTLELDPKHAEVAARNLQEAGVADRVDIMVGPAVDSLPQLDGETFDFTFVDADKVSTSAYVDWAVGHTRPGGLVVVDNVVRNGAVADADSDDANVRGVRDFLARIAGDPRTDTTVIQTVGTKGYDGFAVVAVR
ncbi:MAG: O-methyltransferase [Frankiaceae bacterium]|nr:O-methyltransferase [Frankiaceae bacterium]